MNTMYFALRLSCNFLVQFSVSIGIYIAPESPSRIMWAVRHVENDDQDMGTRVTHLHIPVNQEELARSMQFRKITVTLVRDY